jgi:hypothetical protein
LGDVRYRDVLVLTLPWDLQVLLLALAVVMATSACPYSARISTAGGKAMPPGHTKTATLADADKAVAPGNSRQLKVGDMVVALISYSSTTVPSGSACHRGFILTANDQNEACTCMF